jgi:alpha-L-arabinofuranosidase
MDDNQIDPQYIKALSGLPLPLNRACGTESHQYQWKKTLGTMAQRSPIQLWKWGKPIKLGYGLVEWITSTLAIDPDATFGFVLNMHLDSPQDAADLVEFLTGDAATNPNGGENWAQKRIDLGIAMPVNVAIWELGNEYDHTNALPVDEYVAKCKPYIEAMKQVKSDLHFASLASGSPWNTTRHPSMDQWRSWHRTVLKELGPSIDYLVFHPYYDGIRIPQMEHYLDILRDDIVDVTGENRIKLYFSEHAKWPATSQKWLKTKRPPKLDFDSSHSLEGCLATANFIMRMYQRPEVGAATYHAISGGPWAVVKKDEQSQTLYRTGIFPTFQLLNESLGDNVVQLQLDGMQTALAMKDYRDQTQNYPTLVALAMTTHQGQLHLLLLNRSDHLLREIALQTEYHYRPSQARILSASSLDAFNTATENLITLQDWPLPQSLETLTIPNQSLVLLKLERQ